MPRAFFRLSLSLSLFVALFGAPAPIHAQDSLPELAQALKSGDVRAQIAAANLLADIARNEKTLDPLRDAGAALMPLVNSPNEQVRAAAIEAIGVVRPRTNLVVESINLGSQAFAKTVKDPSPVVRLATARALGAYGAKALQDINEATTPDTRFPLIIDMVNDTKEIASSLVIAMQDSLPDVRAAALQSAASLVSQLASLSRHTSGTNVLKLEEASPGLRLLIQSLDERLPAFAGDVSTVVQNALVALEGSEVENQLTAAAIVEQAADMVRERPRGPYLEVGFLQSSMFQTGGPQAVKALTAALQRGLSALIASLGSSEAAVRIAVLNALEAMGPVANSAVPALIQAAGDPDRFVRWSAVRSLKEVDGGNNPATVHALAARLHDPDYEVRIAALDALKIAGPKSAPAVPALERLLAERDVDLQIGALKTLQNMGPAAKEAVPAITAALKDPDVRVRRQAPILLGALGQEAKSAAPALQAALQDADPEVRLSAARALLAILAGAKSVGVVPTRR